MNREWHKWKRDGRCEATTVRTGEQCKWNGFYDAHSGKILCFRHNP